MLSQEERTICRCFADVLDYPYVGLARAANDCALKLKDSFPELAKQVHAFAVFVDGQSAGSMEEVYTQTFDITPATSLYLGYHLFGETPKRSEFLVRLSEAYDRHSLSIGNELADHLGPMLRFLSVSEDPDFTFPLLDECMLPSLEKTEKELKKAHSEYALVMGPLVAFLRHLTRKPVKSGGPTNA